MALLQEPMDIPAQALKFTALTAARSGEVLGATWDEIDFEDRCWVIPKKRMKRDREHRVPLSDDAMAVIARMADIWHEERIFPMGLNAMRRRLNELWPGITTHGFRSTFRDWASEDTTFPDRVVEAALAHAIGNAVEAAYR